MFIKITNKSGKVNRRYLEKLGISTKRDSVETIGQFGSGAKFAPIAAMRNGWEWISVGYDDNGDYEMHYESREVDGINEVIFVYSDGTVRESSYTLEAGSLSWEDDFQIVREALANAIDAHIETGAEWGWSIVDRIEPCNDDFSVYITNKDDGVPPEAIVDILQNIDNWFSIDRVVLHENYSGKIFRSSNDGEVKIFHKGVRVHEFPLETDRGFSHIFDYQLNNVTLNEERRLRDSYNVNTQIIAILSGLGDDDYGLVRLILDDPMSSWEFSSVSYWNVDNKPWADVWADQWRKIHGQKAIPVAENTDAFIIGRLKARGYRAVVTPEAMRSALICAGVKNFADILGEAFDINTCKISESNQEMFDHAVLLCNNAGIPIDPNDFEFFIDDSFHAPAGRVVGDTRYLNVNLFDGDLSELIGTIVHENDHVVTRYTDGDEMFRSVADSHIGSLVVKLANKVI